jgi:23S rRNA G2445 N2-methylase RlmL
MADVASMTADEHHRAGATRPLHERVVETGFTPAVRDLDPLVDLLGDDAIALSVERAIARVGSPAVPRLLARFDSSRPPIRGRIVRALARLGRDAQDRGRPIEECARAILQALADPDPKTRRNAAIALAHVPAPDAELALHEAWRLDPRPEMRRSIAASLGKMGSEASLAVLTEASHADDAELSRIAERAVVMLKRTLARATPQSDAGIDLSRPALRPVAVHVLARSGLEDLVIEELASAPSAEGPRFDAPGRVKLTLRGPPAALFASRTMLSFCFPLPSEDAGEGGEAEAIARALSSEHARAVFETWTVGPERYRIAWADGGHRRAATWEAARAVARRAPSLSNDPTRSTWEVVVSTRGARIDVAIVPRAVPDPRFSWRVADVPAASHPTIAAALARVAGVRSDDVVWDPFVGSGAELVERARLGPYRALLGSDIDERALRAARRNLESAGLEARLERGDAIALAPTGVTLVITNPPMGRRAVRVAGLDDVLDAFLAHAARTVSAGGRVVWIAPWPARSREAARRAGLHLEWARSVDMGGFGAEMQRWTKNLSR